MRGLFLVTAVAAAALALVALQGDVRLVNASARSDATASTSRPCVTAGRVILGRERISCARAKRVARHFFAYFEAPRGWECSGVAGMAWRGYCESTRSFFRWRPV